MARGADRGFRSPLKARLALALALLSGAFVLFAPAEASAQIVPAPGAGDYCSDRSAPAGTFRADPPFAYLTIGIDGSGSVRASMFGTSAPCIAGEENSVVCPPSCGPLKVQPLCEFHCYHDHTAPYHWDVELAAQPAAPTSYHVGWDRACGVRKEAPRSSCLVRMSMNQSATALFSASPDLAPPSAPVASPGGSTPYSATVNWTPAADNVWLGGYEIVRNGVMVARVAPGTTTYKIENISCQTTYTFRIDAYDAALTTSSNPVQITTGQCLAAARPRPNTIIHVKPPLVTRQRRAYFHFGQRGTVRATKFQCKLDRGRWVACSGRTGKTYLRLKPGYHIFYVRAGNAAGFDPTPARYRWRIRR